MKPHLTPEEEAYIQNRAAVYNSAIPKIQLGPDEARSRKLFCFKAVIRPTAEKYLELRVPERFLIIDQDVNFTVTISFAQGQPATVSFQMQDSLLRMEVFYTSPSGIVKLMGEYPSDCMTSRNTVDVLERTLTLMGPLGG